jgi:hypothetical protein
MALPPTPVLLFKSNYVSLLAGIDGNVMYFEVPVDGTEVNLQVRFTKDGVTQEANEDLSSFKAPTPGVLGLRRFWFYCGPGDYAVFSQVTVGTNIVQSPSNFVRGFTRSAPRCLNARVLTVIDNQIDLELTGDVTFNFNPPQAITVLAKVVGAPSYNIVTNVVQLPTFQGYRCSIVGLTPNTNYQYIVVTNTLISISVTQPFQTSTQGVGCPTGNPAIGPFGGQRNPYLSYNLPPTLPSAVLTVFSSFANVGGANLLCTAYLIDTNGGFILADTNTQDNAALTSVHTFGNLNFNTRYTIVARVANANGFQESVNTPQIRTQTALPDPDALPRGFCGLSLSANTYEVSITELSAEIFIPTINPAFPAPQNIPRPPFQMTIEVAPTRSFNPEDIVNYLWVRDGIYTNAMHSVNELPVGPPLYARCRIYDPIRNSLTYSNLAIFDGLAARKI